MNGKRFDSWTEVDCNECSNYWNNSCDGIAPEARRKPCNSFLAKRSITIPAELKSLRDDINTLRIAFVVESVAAIGYMIVNLFWR